MTDPTPNQTVTVTLDDSARPGIRSVQIGDFLFPVGQPVHEVPDKIIDKLQEMPGVNVDVAGKDNPDIDVPEITNQ